MPDDINYYKIGGIKMRNKTVKVLALMLTAVMACTACGQQKSVETQQKEESQSKVVESSTTEAEESLYYNKEGFPFVNEEITIKILTTDTTSATEISKTGDAPFWDYLSEKTGIKFEFESYMKEELATKLSLIMSDPDSMPDIFWACSMTEDTLIAGAEQGLFLELDDYIDELGPNIQACFASNDSNKGFATAVDGHIYSLPSYNAPRVAWPFMVNDRWMENCGIEEYPKNLAEFKDMLIKFRDMDANGNGDPNDEIPLHGNINHMLQILCNAAGIQLDWPWQGAVWSSEAGSTETFPLFTNDKFRYVMEYIVDLYDEGLIDQDLFTISSDEFNARRDNDRYGVYPRESWGVMGSYDPDNFSAMPLMTSDVNDTVSYFVQPSYQTCMAVISANTKYPEVCVRLLDYMMSADGSAMSTCYNPADYDLKAAGVSQEVIDILSGLYENKTSDEVLTVIANWIGMYGCRWTGQLDSYKYLGEYSNNVQKTQYENIQSKQTEDNMVTQYTYSLKFTPEENEVIAQYQTDIDLFVKDKIPQWVVGKEELNDANWNAYKAQLEKMNLAELNAVYEKAVKRFYGIN